MVPQVVELISDTPQILHIERLSSLTALRSDMLQHRQMHRPVHQMANVVVGLRFT